MELVETYSFEVTDSSRRGLQVLVEYIMIAMMPSASITVIAIFHLLCHRWLVVILRYAREQGMIDGLVKLQQRTQEATTEIVNSTAAAAGPSIAEDLYEEEVVDADEPPSESGAGGAGPSPNQNPKKKKQRS